MDVTNERLTGENRKASNQEKDEYQKSETNDGIHGTRTVRRKKLIVISTLDHPKKKEVKR